MTNQLDEQRHITLADVATHAGFSRSTASLVFQGSTLVAGATRDRVLAASEELGYVYNRRAAGLRMQRSGTIGFLVAGLSNPHFSALFEAVGEELGQSDYTVLLGDTLDDPARQATLLRTFLEYRVDGLLIVPAVGSTSDFTKPLDSFRVPHVMLTRHIGGPTSSYVGSNDHLGGQLAARHLLHHGCRNIAFFGGPADVFARADRLLGISAEVQKAGADFSEEWSVHSKTESTDGYDKAAALLAAGAVLPDGIICHSDAIAFGLMRAIRDGGAVIGTDVRVIGFDDVEHARNWSPSLTSISVSVGRLGRDGARLLLDRLKGSFDEPRREIIFDPQLRVRESCGVEP